LVAVAVKSAINGLFISIYDSIFYFKFSYNFYHMIIIAAKSLSRLAS